jgi:hypothetical protein
MGRPGQSTPKPTTGRPGGPRPHVIPDKELDAMIAHNDELIQKQAEQTIEQDWIGVKGEISRKSAKAIAIMINHHEYQGEIWVPNSCWKDSPAEGIITLKTWFWDKKKQDLENELVSNLLDPQAEQGAKDFQQQADTIHLPKEITLILLDGAFQNYVSLVDAQAEVPNGSEMYWDLQKKIGKQNALLINMGQHWRAQQDRLNREALDRHTKALHLRTSGGLDS